MTLPPSFDNPAQYFHEALNLFEAYEYLYNFANTKVLINGVFDQINIDIEDGSVFNKDFTLNSLADSNEEIKKLLQLIDKISVEYKVIDKIIDDEDLHVPLSLKKKHEIIYLTKEIVDLCEDFGVDTVVDFGSGLGYLDQMIFDRKGYNVLGIECQSQHYVGAKMRQHLYHERSKGKVKYVVHKISENSSTFIENAVIEKFGKKNYCIAGLHACADLTVDAMNLFIKMPNVTHFILMSCCYHKMIKSVDSFANFPLSKALKEIWHSRGRKDFLNVPFLRLAAQPPTSEEHLEDLVFNLISRGVLELYAYERNYKITRKKRKAVNTKLLNRNFQEYVRNAKKNGFSLKCNGICINEETEQSPDKAVCDCSLAFDVETLNEYWGQITKSSIDKAAIFILIQRRLQPVFENFILYDRVIYLKENGVSNCRVKQILDSMVSPRCFAMIASKK